MAKKSSVSNNDLVKGLWVVVNGDATGLKKAMTDAQSTMKSYQRSFKDINKSIKLDPSNIDLYRQKQEILKKTIEETDKTITTLEKQKAEVLSHGAKETDEVYQKLILNISKAKNELKSYQKEMTALSPNQQAFNARLEETADSLDNISRRTAGVSRVFTQLLSGTLSQTQAFETNIANIRKVIKDLSDDTVNALKEISTTTGASFDAVSEYATIGATLGIAQEDIASFTKTLVDLETATSGAISGEEGAKAVARFLNVMGLDTSLVQNFGSAITYVGDQFAATGDEVLEMASRMAGLKTITEVSQYDLIGLAAEMKNVAVMTTSGASAITRTFMAIENNVETNGDQLEAFARTAGMSAKKFKEAWSENSMDTFLKFVDGLKTNSFEEIDKAINKNSNSLNDYAKVIGTTTEKFKEMWGKDAQGTFNKYVEALSELDDESESASVILKELKLNGVRTAETLLKLAGNGDTVRRAISDANKAWNENTALTEKAGTVYDTLEYKLKATFESIKQLGATLGDSVLPFIKDLADTAKKLVQGFSNMNGIAKALIITFLTLGATFSKTAKFAATSIRTYTTLSKFIGNLKATTAAAKAGEVAMSGFSLGVGGIGLAVVAAIGGLALLASNIQWNNKVSVQHLNTLKKENKELQDLTKNSNENYNSFKISSQYAKTYIDDIEELRKQLQETNLTDEERVNLQDKLQLYVEKFNEALGGTYIQLGNNNVLIDEQGQKIDNLSAKYETLAEKARKNAWLSAHQDEYAEAIDNVYKADEAIAEAERDLINALKGTDFKILQQAIDLFNEGYSSPPQGTENSSYVYGVMEWLRKTQEAKQEATEIKNSAQEIIDNYEKIINSEAGTFDETIKGFATAKENVDLYNKSLEELEATKDGLEKELYVATVLGVDEEEVAKIKEQLGIVKEQIEVLEEAAKKERQAAYEAKNRQLAAEQASEKARGLIAEDDLFAKQEADALKEYIKTDIEEMADLTTKKVESVAKFVNALYETLVKVRNFILKPADSSLEYDMNFSNNRGGGRGIPVPIDSGGYGLRIDKIANSIAKAQSNSKMQSGGYGNNVVLNNTININSQTAITRSEVMRWADIMTDRINDNLGRQM